MTSSSNYESHNHIPEPELSNLQFTESVKVFNDAWRMPEDIARKQLGDFFSVAVAVKDNLIDPDQSKQVAAVMGQLTWLYFGESGSLPLSMAIDGSAIKHDYHLGLVSLDTTLSRQNIADIVHQFDLYGLKKIDEERAELRQANPDLVGLYTQAVKASPQYQFLSSFETSKVAVEEKPLSAFEKQIEVAKAEAIIRRRFSLADHVSLKTINDPQPKRELDRQLYQIDEATKLERAEPQTPLELARQFFKQELRTFAETAEPEHIRQMLTALLQESETDSDLREHYAIHIDERLNSAKSEFYDSDRLIYAFLDKLYKPDTGSVEECLDYALERMHITPDILPFLVAEKNLSAKRMMSLRGGGEATVVTIDTSGQPIKPVRFFSNSLSSGIFIESLAAITSKEDYDRKMKKVFATVERSPGNRDQVSRLIQRELTQPGMPGYKEFVDKEPGAYDLKLQFDIPTQHLIQIAGYKLTAIKDNNYFFSRSSEHDPYVLPDQAITSVEQQRLVELADRLKATALSSWLTRRKNPTVADLVAAIEIKSDYTFEQSFKGDELVLPGVYSQHGRLQMQCDGAATVLRKFLSKLDRGEPYVVTGLVLDADSDVVSASGHAEVEWIDAKGRTYRLDATPRSESTAGSGQPINAETSRRRFFGRLLGKRADQTKDEVAVAPKPDAEKPKVIVNIVDTIKPPIITANEVIEQLELNLRATTGTANQGQLYEKIAGLKSADPLRRTLEVSLQARQNKLTEAELESLNEYLQNLATADEQLLKTMNLPQYQSGTLQMLQRFVQQLGALQKV